MRIIHLVTGMVAVLALAACNKTGPPEKIDLCQGGIITPLTLLAQEKGYYAKEGLELAFHPLGDGKLAMEAFLAGKCDAAVVAEPPIIAKTVAGVTTFNIIATVATTDNATRIVADRRRGISVAGNLKGKRLAARKGNVTHYFLDLYLKQHEIGPDQLTIRFVEPAQLAEELVQGKIDAYAASDIYLFEGIRRLGEHAVVLSEPGLSFNSSYLLVRKETLTQKPELARKLLRALLRAEARAARNPDEVIGFVAKRREISEQMASDIVKQQRLAVTLHQHLLLTLDDHTVWMQDQGMITSTVRPDYRTIINDSFLRELSPAAVTIVR